jgi:hypothetical protein
MLLALVFRASSSPLSRWRRRAHGGKVRHLFLLLLPHLLSLHLLHHLIPY